MYLTCKNNRAKNAVNITTASNQIVDFFILINYLRFSYYISKIVLSIINLTNKRLFCLTYPLKIEKMRKKTGAIT